MKAHHEINFLPVSIFSGLNTTQGYTVSVTLSIILPAMIQAMRVIYRSLKISKYKHRFPCDPSHLAFIHKPKAIGKKVIHTACSLLVTMQQAAGMLIMLLVMSLNVWIVLSVILSSVLSYFFTAWILFAPPPSHRTTKDDRGISTQEETKKMLEQQSRDEWM